MSLDTPEKGSLAAGDPFGYLHHGSVRASAARSVTGANAGTFASSTRQVLVGLQCSDRINAAPFAAGDPFGYLHQGASGPVQHVAYGGHDGRIQELCTSYNSGSSIRSHGPSSLDSKA